MTERHRIHATAAAYAVRHFFRLNRNDRGIYTLVGNDGRPVDCPAWGETTAAGALRMMRRHVRLGRNDGRAVRVSYRLAESPTNRGPNSLEIIRTTYTPARTVAAIVDTFNGDAAGHRRAMAALVRLTGDQNDS